MPTIWVPLQEVDNDPSLPLLMILARQAEPHAIRALEAYVAKVGRQEAYIVKLMQLVWPEKDFEITTGPNLFHGNTIRHHFRSNELFDLVQAYPMQRVQAIVKALRGLPGVEE